MQKQPMTAVALVVAIAGTFAVVVMVLHAIAPLRTALAMAPASREERPLVEAATCASPATPEPVTSAVPAAADAATATVTVFVPPMVWVRWQADVPVAATTNTGCAPRRSDMILDERGMLITEAARATVLASVNGGDWRHNGRWVALDPRPSGAN